MVILLAMGFAGAAVLTVQLSDWKAGSALRAPYPLQASSHPPASQRGRFTAEVADSPTITPAASEPDALGLPLKGLRASDLHDSYKDARQAGHGVHEAIDLIAPRGTPVLAMVTGTVKKLFTSKQGGLTVYQFDRAEVFCYYYAHLDHYDSRIVEGQVLRRGEVLGYVGSTGNANPSNPHLHLEITRLGSDKKWWQGKPLNPFPVLMGLVRGR